MVVKNSAPGSTVTQVLIGKERPASKEPPDDDPPLPFECGDLRKLEEVLKGDLSCEAADARQGG